MAEQDRRAYAEVAPDALVPNRGNWRTHPKAEARALEGALGDVGWVSPIAADDATEDRHPTPDHPWAGHALARDFTSAVQVASLDALGATMLTVVLTFLLPRRVEHEEWPS